MQNTIDLETGRCFFHYTTREAAFDHILPTRQLRFSTYEQMRDPLENSPWQFVGAYFVDPTDPTRGEKHLLDFYRGSHSIFRLAHLLAVTVNAEGYSVDGEDFANGWGRARMWEQYAEEHARVR